MGNIKGRFSEEELETMKSKVFSTKKSEDWYRILMDLNSDQEKLEEAVRYLEKECGSRLPFFLTDFSMDYINSPLIGNEGGIKDFEAVEGRSEIIAHELLKHFKKHVVPKPEKQEYVEVKLEGFEPKKKGLKFSDDKAPMGKLLKQFPLAFEQVAFRTKAGHEKYNIDGADDDWKNFTRVENANYEDAAIRHFCGLGEEAEIEHMAASIWNQLAELQIKLENNE